MARRDEHVGQGMAAATAMYARRCVADGKGPELGHVALALAGGVVGARLPDLIEPATHPGHRALAHSAVMLTAVAGFMGCAAKEPTTGLNVLLESMAAGYAAHLVRDACTPAGLPLLHRRSGRSAPAKGSDLTWRA